MRGDVETKLDGVVPEGELTSVLNDEDDEPHCEEYIAERLADLEKAYKDCAAGTCPNTDETVDKIEAELAKAKDPGIDANWDQCGRTHWRIRRSPPRSH